MLRRPVQRRQVQGHFGEEHEPAPAQLVDEVEGWPHALYEIADSATGRLLRICEEPADAEIVSANPQSVHGIVRLPVLVQRVIARGGIDVGRVGRESLHLILLDGGQRVRKDISAYSAGY